jgi:hypothetical protein
MEPKSYDLINLSSLCHRGYSFPDMILALNPCGKEKRTKNIRMLGTVGMVLAIPTTHM